MSRTISFAEQLFLYQLRRYTFNMEQRVALRAISRLASLQHGLVTTRQASRVGVSRVDISRLCLADDLERVTYGVYLVRGADSDEHTERRANWLALDPGRTLAERAADHNRVLAASHRTAAAIHGIGDLFAYDHTFTSTRRLQTSRDGVTVHTSSLPAGDVMVAKGMLVTTAERTLVDLAVTEPDLSQIAGALDDALRAHLIDLESLTPRLAVAAPRHGQRNGPALIERMLAYSEVDLASELDRFRTSIAATFSAMEPSTKPTWAKYLVGGGLSLAAAATLRQRIGERNFKRLLEHLSEPTSPEETHD